MPGDELGGRRVLDPTCAKRQPRQNRDVAHILCDGAPYPIQVTPDHRIRFGVGKYARENREEEEEGTEIMHSFIHSVVQSFIHSFIHSSV